MNLIDQILTHLDIDAGQWRALVGLSYKVLKRKRPAISSKKGSSVNGLWIGLFFYGFMGVIFIPMIVLPAKTAGIASFFLLDIILIFIASMILLEFGASIVYPEDISVLSPRPISSRTYFASRMTIVVFVILLYAVALGGPSVVAFCVKFGIISALAWAFTLVCAGLATGMLMILIYTTAARYAKPSRIQHIMGYTQLFLSFIVYGGYGVFLEKMRGIVAMASPDQWSLLLPTSWFASIVATASGDWTIANIVGSSISILTSAALFFFIAGRISLTYSETVAEAAIGTASPAPSPKRRRSAFHFFRRAEDRAIAMLISRQFRHDVKFKMSVLAILPLTLFYLYQGIQGGKGISDPFSTNVALTEFGSSILLYVAMILFPVFLKYNIIQNDMHEAAWIFFASPVDRGKVMLSVRRVLIRAFVLPYLGMISLVFLWFFENPLHVIMHMAVVFFICDVFLSVLFFFNPALPFSLPREVGEINNTVLSSMIIGPIIVLALMAIFIKLLYPALWSYLAGVAALLILSFLLRHLLEKRLKKEGEQLEFLG